MPLYLRKIIMWLFVLAFFIITPLVLLSTSGWNYNWKIGKIESTGVIIIDIQNPRMCAVEVENYEKTTLLPFTVYHLNQLKPGEYKVKIEKETYLPWEKTIEVTGNSTAFVDKVVLFKNNQSTLLEMEKIQQWFGGSDRYAIFHKENSGTKELWLFDAYDESQDLLYRQVINPLSNATAEVEAGDWSAQSSYFLWKNNGKHQIFNINNLSEDPMDLDKLLLPETIKQYQWNSDNDNVLYVLNSVNQLWQININNRSTLKLADLPTDTASATVLNQNIYYLQNNAENVTLYQLIKDETTKLMDFNAGDYQLQTLTAGIFRVKDLMAKKSYLFVANKDQLTFQEINAIDLKLSPSKNKFTYSSNTFEIWTLENFYSTEKKGDTYLLTRLSQTPENLQWHNSNEYLYYTINNELKIIELDGRGNQRNIYTWTLDGQIKGLISDKKHSILYLATENGLHKLVIGD
ncbi:MAG TPA: PEGA domain-containing protein [bacterium]|nr:PEGA domain-containing protein [bacterium]